MVCFTYAPTRVDRGEQGQRQRAISLGTTTHE
jgi:hypothetical protein